MANTGETRYARHGDVHLAYQVTGAGPLDLLLVPDGFIATEPLSEERACARFLERLGSFARVIRYDRRGMGLSDPVTPANPPTLEQWVEDALAVLDALGCKRAALVGLAEGCFVTTVLAATHPERTAALVLVHPSPGSSPYGADGSRVELHARLDADLDAVWDGDLRYEDIAAFAPSRARDPSYRDWLLRALRRSVSPAAARALFDVVLRSDVEPVLNVISAPTLVLHRSANRYVTPDYSRHVAACIPGARFVELPGEDHVAYLGDTEPILGEIEEFLTGVRRAPEPDRVLATVLFTDIVASTERASRLGDAGWRALLDRHDEIVERRLGQYRGRLVKTTGDGVLATFDGPARAIRCAAVLRDELRGIGLETRSGVHTGEIEIRGDDIGGIAVHIASRVEACAAPGEVLVSALVPPLVAGSGLEFDERGEHQLKGVPGTSRLYAVQGRTAVS